MQKTRNIIDIFVHIVDNYGDMGFACEFLEACRSEFGNQYSYVIWTNSVIKMQEFVRQSGISDISVVDIIDFGILRKSAIGISLLHAPLPDLDSFEEKALILRIDYLSLDPTWIRNNERQYIFSTSDRQIIELIPSPLEDSAGLIVSPFPSSRTKQSETTGSVAIQVSEYGLLRTSQGQKSQKHIVIFVYPDALDRIDWDSFPDEIDIYVFGKIDSKRENIILLDFISTHEFYSLLDTSEFVIIRGEVTFAHIIQARVPFFWNMYSDVGGFPSEQSEQYLSMIGASSEYRDIHNILNHQKPGKISYMDCVRVLSHTRFPPLRIHNLIHVVKKHIDRFNNSI